MTELDRRIKALCEAKGITFKPWEFPPPWDISEQQTPFGPNDDWTPKCLALRAKLKAELKKQ